MNIAPHTARGHGADEFNLSNWVQDQLGKADHLHTHGFEVEIRRTGFCIQPFATVIHSADRLDPNATSRHRHMLDFAQTVPAEEEQTYKGGFEEEGHQTFNTKWRTGKISPIVGNMTS